MLPVTSTTFVPLTTFLFKHDNFLIFLIFEDLGSNGCSLNRVLAKCCLAFINDHEYLVDFYLITFMCVRKTIQRKLIAFLNSKLTSLGFYGSLHG